MNLPFFLPASESEGAWSLKERWWPKINLELKAWRGEGELAMCALLSGCGTLFLSAVPSSRCVTFNRVR